MAAVLTLLCVRMVRILLYQSVITTARASAMMKDLMVVGVAHLVVLVNMEVCWPAHGTASTELAMKILLQDVLNVYLVYHQAHRAHRAHRALQAQAAALYLFQANNVSCALTASGVA